MICVDPGIDNGYPYTSTCFPGVSSIGMNRARLYRLAVMRPARKMRLRRSYEASRMGATLSGEAPCPIRAPV